MFSSVFSFHFLPFPFQFQPHTSQFLQGLGSKTETWVTLRIPTNLRDVYGSDSSSAMGRTLTALYLEASTCCRHNNIPWPLRINCSICQYKMWGLEVKADQQGQYQRWAQGERSKQQPHLQWLLPSHDCQLNVLPTRLHHLGEAERSITSLARNSLQQTPLRSP